MPDNVERLVSVLGFDPAKSGGDGSIIQEALKEIKDEEAKAKKAKAKEQLLKAAELRKKMVEAKKQFDGQMKKFDKELGKVLNQIEATARGQCACDCKEGGTDECKEDKGEGCCEEQPAAE